MWQDNWWEKCKYIFGCHSITQRHFYVLQINGIAKNVFFFIFPLYLHYHRFDWKNFSITNAKNLFMRWFFYPIMIDWILNIFSFEFIIQSSLTKLDCPFAIFKCHAYLSIIILFFSIYFLQSIPQVQTQVRRNTTLIYWRLMSFTQNLEFRDYEEN